MQTLFIIALHNFLQNGLAVIKHALVLNIRHDITEHKGFGSVKTAIQKDSTDHCLQGIWQDRFAGPAPCHVLSFAQIDIRSQIDLFGTIGKSRFTDHTCTKSRKISFRQIPVIQKQKFTGNSLKHSIAQKFQPFVVG